MPIHGGFLLGGGGPNPFNGSTCESLRSVYPFNYYAGSGYASIGVVNNSPSQKRWLGLGGFLLISGATTHFLYKRFCNKPPSPPSKNPSTPPEPNKLPNNVVELFPKGSGPNHSQRSIAVPLTNTGDSWKKIGWGALGVAALIGAGALVFIPFEGPAGEVALGGAAMAFFANAES